MIILRPKNVIFERLWLLSKFHFPACSTLVINHLKFKPVKHRLLSVIHRTTQKNYVKLVGKLIIFPDKSQIPVFDSEPEFNYLFSVEVKNFRTVNPVLRKQVSPAYPIKTWGTWRKSRHA